MATNKIKVSQLQESSDLRGLFALGVDSLNRSVKVSLGFIAEKFDGLDDVIERAETAANDANQAAAEANQAAADAAAEVEEIKNVLQEVNLENVVKWNTASVWQKDTWTPSGFATMRFMKDTSKPENGAVDGVWFVQNSPETFTLHVVSGGVVVSLDALVTKESIGLGNVNNTSDADKPVSTATQNALGNKLDSNKVGVSVASLVNGKVPKEQSYKFLILRPFLAEFPETGDADSFYIATETLQTYIWKDGTYKLLAGGGGSDVNMFDYFVSYRESQNLSEAQKALARTNIGAIAADGVVRVEGSQIINGDKSFSKALIVAGAPTHANHVVRLTELSKAINDLTLNWSATDW